MKKAVNVKCDKGKIKTGKSIEVGNIFRLGTRYAEAMGLFYADKNGVKKPVVMGCYGIGPGRVMGTIVEIHHDPRGISWPENLAPFRTHILELGTRNLELGKKVKKMAEALYEKLTANDVEVLYDDRDDKSAGEKFADADLVGIPWRVVVSEKMIEKKGVEVKRRDSDRAKIISPAQLMKYVK